MTTAVSTDTEIQPFRIKIPQDDLDDLRDRLARTRWPKELPGTGWSDGVPLGYVKGLVEYWHGTYDWRVHEARLNEFPQFITTIDRADIHFIHVRSPEPHALPLLMTNGWPSSIVDFMHVIGPLTDPRSHGGDPADAFHVVAPSIPGFAFSRARESGWNLDRVTRAYAELMDRLGYGQYGAHGGDFGSLVSPELGRLHPDRVVGVHLTGLLTMLATDAAGLAAALTPAEQARMEEVKRFTRRRRWYAMVQATRPQTLAYALTDSPVGQVTWMVDVFKEITDSEVLEDAIDRDHFLTNVSLYWLTGTAGSAALLFKETSRDVRSVGAPSTVPTGMAVFPREPLLPIRALAERSHTIVHWSEFDRGGHFPAIEVPNLVIDDLRKFFRAYR
ncbi:MAG: alpha/beta fold hydrolase [Luteitalea sp.]|nr:alpha/beta fold hydrolase [Luteitalea sp.]